MSDEGLVARLKARDAEAFAEVFAAHSDQIYRLALRLLHDEQQADGVVQNTFLALIEHIDTFGGQSKISTWLYRVAYNDAMGRLRKAKPIVELDTDESEVFMPQNFTDWQTLPDSLLQSNELQQTIQKAVNQLPPGLQSVFQLRDIEELSTEECATILGITVGAVKVRLHRARLVLRENLASYFEERTKS